MKESIMEFAGAKTRLNSEVRVIERSLCDLSFSIPLSGVAKKVLIQCVEKRYIPPLFDDGPRYMQSPSSQKSFSNATNSLLV